MNSAEREYMNKMNGVRTYVNTMNNVRQNMIRIHTERLLSRDQVLLAKANSSLKGIRQFYSEARAHSGVLHFDPT